MATLVALLVLVGLAALLYASWRRRRLGVVFIGVTVAFAVLWALAFVAFWTDYRDADGFVDCWPGCSAFQHAVGATVWLGPPLFVVLALLAALLGVIRWRRERRGRAPRRSG